MSVILGTEKDVDLVVMSRHLYEVRLADAEDRGFNKGKREEKERLQPLLDVCWEISGITRNVDDSITWHYGSYSTEDVLRKIRDSLYTAKEFKP